MNQEGTKQIECCVTCYYARACKRWNEETKQQENYLECRYGPPALLEHLDEIRAFWPPVDGDKWCGQYKREDTHG